MATSGPGAAHLVNGLYDAKGDNQPVVADRRPAGPGRQRQRLPAGAQPRADLLRRRRVRPDRQHPDAGPDGPRQGGPGGQGAARSRRVVILPADVQELEMEEPAAEHGVSRSGVGLRLPAVRPDRGRAAPRRATCSTPARRWRCSSGRVRGGPPTRSSPWPSGSAPAIITALLGKDVVPADVPFHTQQLGLLGSRPSYDMMQDCDTLLLVGTNFPYGEFLPTTGQARAVQIDTSPGHLGHPLPHRGQPLGRRRGHPRRAAPASARAGRPPVLAGGHRRRDARRGTRRSSRWRWPRPTR